MQKKIIQVFVLFLLTCSLCGCNGLKVEKNTDKSVNENNGTGEEKSVFSMDDYMGKFSGDRVNIKEYKDLYDTEKEELNNNEIGKLSFETCDFGSIEEVDTVSVLKFSSKGISVDESWNIIKNWLQQIDLADIDMDKEVRDASGQFDRDEKKEYPYDYPGVMEHYSELETGNGFFINTDQCYLQMGENGIYSMSDGTITAYRKSGSLAAMDAFGADEEDIIKRGSLPEMKEEEWELLSGMVAVKDAADIVKKYFEAGTPYPPSDGIQVDVPQVSVFSLKDKYGYAFTVRRKYQGVPFAYALTGSRNYYGSEYEMDEDTKEAYIVNDKTVNAFTGYSEAENLEALSEAQDSMIPLKGAVSILNKKLAEQMRVGVERVELVYCPMRIKEKDKIAFPCWAFTGTNLMDQKNMRIYLDALTGEIYYYTYRE